MTASPAEIVDLVSTLTHWDMIELEWEIIREGHQQPFYYHSDPQTTRDDPPEMEMCPVEMAIEWDLLKNWQFLSCFHVSSQ